jgi:chaperone required for assembly of F1-ATPase
MKRVYKAVSTKADPDGHSVLLDGRPVRSPGGAALRLPTSALAEAVAAEWDAQTEKIQPASMPMMTLSATAADRVLPQRAAVARDAAGYAASDLLCYRADTPVELAQRQAEAWDPVLDWARRRYGVEFAVTAGLMPVDQPPKTIARFQALAEALDAFPLTALHVMTTACGSFLLALSVYEGHAAPDEAYALASLDEAYQAELWGKDAEAVARRARVAAEVAEAKRFLDLL